MASPARSTSALALAVAIVLVALPAVAAAAPPPNDDFIAAQPLSGENLAVPGSNVEATGETGEPDHAFASVPLASVWYRWVAPADGPVAIDTCDTDSDTTLAVYTGGSVDALTEVESSDDGFACESLGSSVRFLAAAGETYQIAVDGYEDVEGEFTLAIEFGSVPANDAFADAESLTGGSTFAVGNNVGATGEAGEPDHAGASVPLHSVWYRWRAPAAGPVLVDTCFADFDTTLAVYRGTSVSGLTEVASNDDSDLCFDVTSSVEFRAARGETYSIAVDGFEDASGDFFIGLEQEPAPTPPPPPPPAPPPPAATQPPPPGQPAPSIISDRTPPSIEVLGRRLRMTRTGRVRVRLRCRDALSRTCTGAVRVRTARRLPGRSRPGPVRLGRKSFVIDAGSADVVTMKLRRRARRLVTGLEKVRVRVFVAARDAAGNTDTTARRMRLTAARR